ncbi:hypothetical protein Taro_011791 [Colocasia esculenta]|uniref:PHD finger protein ALFIN-LIKE n=1 Tax=Colocasia esculenta TaxID=4460 RepID=A0A843UBT9_COLES|nr:hypothetical protein [Colocasia esculenta]
MVKIVKNSVFLKERQGIEAYASSGSEWSPGLFDGDSLVSEDAIGDEDADLNRNKLCEIPPTKMNHSGENFHKTIITSGRELESFSNGGEKEMRWTFLRPENPPGAASDADRSFEETRARRLGVNSGLTREAAMADGRRICVFMGFPMRHGKKLPCLLRKCLRSFLSQHWELINFARDGMDTKDWLLALVAVHSDAWLLAVAFYSGDRFGFDKEAR